MMNTKNDLFSLYLNSGESYFLKSYFQLPFSGLDNSRREMDFQISETV